MNRFLPACIIAFVLLLIKPEVINCGEIYKWVDENGVVHFSDAPADSSVFEEDSSEIMPAYESVESAQDDNKVAAKENESNGEKKGTFIESSSEIYQSFTEHDDSKNVKSIKEMTNGEALTDTIVQPNPEIVLDDQNLQTYNNIPIENNPEYIRIKRQIARLKARIAAENERKRIEKKKEIEVQNDKIRAENERRRIENIIQLQEYEKRKQAIEKRDAEAWRHNQRIRYKRPLRRR